VQKKRDELWTLFKTRNGETASWGMGNEERMPLRPKISHFEDFPF